MIRVSPIHRKDTSLGLDEALAAVFLRGNAHSNTVVETRNRSWTHSMNDNHGKDEEVAIERAI